ncbi:MAG: ABC transporter ATP-binding protein [Candidatus Heimdallarchaeota archaeon]|nr:ABC transporter ATP-binding protein [Candidatus Heimdallarchaeota archaeon]
MSEIVIETKNVESGYGKLQIIFGIDLVLRKGELVTIIGPNGSGKSTLIKTIIGLVQPWSGKVIINDEYDVSGMRPFEIVNAGIPINYVPQVANVFPTLSVLENLKLGALPRKTKEGVKEDLAQIYGLFPRLEERKHQKAALLSGGERQMLALGRALMSRPEILILDEPTAALAPVLADEIFAKIVELQKLGLSILLVEQRATRALSISDRGYVLVSGKVAFQGDAKDLIGNKKIGELYLGKRSSDDE